MSCYADWCCAKELPKPFTVTNNRAVIYAYPLGCPGNRFSVNYYDRQQTICCCAPSNPTLPMTAPPQLQGAVSSEEFNEIVKDTQNVYLTF